MTSRLAPVPTPTTQRARNRSARNLTGRLSRPGTRRPLLISAALAAITLATAVMATAASAAPVLRVSMLKPDYVTPGKYMAMFTTIFSDGDTPLSGNVTIRYTFPAGVAITDPESEDTPPAACTQSGQVDECVIDVTGVPVGHAMVYETLTPVDPSATGTLTGQIEVSGGGAASPVTVPLSFSTEPIGPFDIKSFDTAITDAPGQAPAQAGSDPSEISTGVEMFSQAVSNEGVPTFSALAPSENFRDVTVHVPAGLVGFPTATETRCTVTQLSEQSPFAQEPNCPRDSQIGLVLVNGKDVAPIFNIVPPHGTPAEFGFFYQGVIVFLKARLRPSDNGIDIVTEKAPSAIPIPKFEVTLWGIPSDSSHDGIRAECTIVTFGPDGNQCPSQAPRVPFLRLPTSCTGPLPWKIEMTTYQHPNTPHIRETTSPGMTGCGLNPFEPNLTLAPSTLTPHASAGVETVLTMPQAFGPHGIAPADIRTVSVTLPEGLTLNPSSADGLQACTDNQLNLGQAGVATCPDASTLGTVLIKTPLLDHPVAGTVFLRTQASSDPLSGDMYRIAIELRSDDDGIDIKLPGAVKADPVTGRLTTVFDELPQLPFESMTLKFKTGPRAPLVTPRACGTYATHTEFTSWGNRTVSTDSAFTITGDGNGAPCAAPLFAPALTAGTTNPVAGVFSPFALDLTRTDEDSPFNALNQLNLPPGLLANAASVPVRCTDAQAAAAACPAASHIGTVTVGAGAGSNPFYQSGDVYLMGQQTSGPFKGDPFGLAVIDHAVAGPFDLGYVVVKAGIQIHDDGSVTTRSEPFPSILQGIPLQLRDIRVNLDRPGFMINPTSCAPKSISGSVSSLQGQSAALSSRFQVGDCSGLVFKPDFKASTAGKTSKANGAALRVHLGTHEGPGTTAREANIAKVDVQLPAILPSRLTTLQKACAAAQFEADPAGCPEGAFVGTAIAHTPILASPLSGPAILVSHGGVAFPDVVLVLQGEGIRLDLTGHTQIKKGITFSHFETVPDAPVQSFDLNLPQGPHSVLAANLPKGRHSLCGQKLTMPTRITAQNGAEIKQTTKITVTGCTAAKAAKHAKKASRRGR